MVVIGCRVCELCMHMHFIFEATWAKSNRSVSIDRSMTLSEEKRRKKRKKRKKRRAGICFYSD
jgi:hypothetical protein